MEYFFGDFNALCLFAWSSLMFTRPIPIEINTYVTHTYRYKDVPIAHQVIIIINIVNGAIEDLPNKLIIYSAAD